MVISDLQRLRQQVKGGWTRYQAGLIALSVTLLGAGLRLYQIGANSFNNDEVFSIWLAGHHTSFIVQFTTFGGGDVISPPFHYVLLRALLLIGEQPLVLRLPSVFAGTLMVWLTFRLAAYLFDLRVATLSAFLMAVAPLHVALSRVARAHTLSSLWALFSLYFFARLLFQDAQRRHWVGLVAATAAALWTFHTTFLVVLFENAWMAFLWLRRHLSRSMLVGWLTSQIALGILVLPALISALIGFSSAKINWLTRPGLQSLVKSAILFSTGDPSYGPIGVTPARIFSLMTIVGLGTLGLWTFLQRGYHRRLDDEGRRVLFLVCAFMIPWVTAFAISQVRPIYRERYFLFTMLPLFILFAWIFTRARQVIISSLVLLALVSLTGSALFVYYTEPFGEQWREAIAYMRPAYQSDDPVVISPGFYCRPFAYYFYGDFPEDTDTLESAPAIVVENEDFRAFSLLDQAEGLSVDDPALATAQRIWFVSGYAPVDPKVMTWIEQNFEPLDTGEFLGAHVRLLKRTQGAGTQATPIREQTMRGETILCIAPRLWHSLWRDTQPIMWRAAKQNRVLYFEPSRKSNRPYLAEMWRNWPNFMTLRAQALHENLIVIPTPSSLPVARRHLPRSVLQVTTPWVAKINARILIRHVRWAMKAYSVEAPILWLYSPFHVDLVGKFEEKLACYYNYDEFPDFVHNRRIKELLRLESGNTLEEIRCKRS